MKIVLHPLAIEDVVRGKQFYEYQQFGLGIYFEDTIFSDIESLNLYAGIHQLSFGHYRTLSKIFPFAIYYTLDSEIVNIWRILDCRIKPAYIKKALK